MSILNIMWAGGSAFASVQKVHQQILSHAVCRAPITTWLLQGRSQEGESALEWNLSSARLKGRHLWKLLMPWMRARFQKALPDDLQVVLLDGVGVARVMLPVLKHLPHVRAVVVFHGVTRMRRADQKLFEQFPAQQLTLAAVSQTLAHSIERFLQRPVTVLRSAFDPVAFRNAALWSSALLPSPHANRNRYAEPHRLPESRPPGSAARNASIVPSHPRTLHRARTGDIP